MSAPHFFVDPAMLADVEPGDVVALGEADSAHALRSLRLRAGDAATVSDGEGKLGAGRVVGERGGIALVELDLVRIDPRPVPIVTVGLAPPKGDRLSWAVQKLIEIGVDGVVLTRCERSVRMPKGAEGGERLRRVAREAAMQSRRSYLPRIWTEARSLARVLTDSDGLVVMLHEGAERPLRSCLPDGIASAVLLVGPEGGFSEREVYEARAAGAAVATLGTSILRTETAAVVAATLTLHRYGRLG